MSMRVKDPRAPTFSSTVSPPVRGIGTSRTSTMQRSPFFVWPEGRSSWSAFMVGVRLGHPEVAKLRIFGRRRLDHTSARSREWVARARDASGHRPAL